LGLRMDRAPSRLGMSALASALLAWALASSFLPAAVGASAPAAYDNASPGVTYTGAASFPCSDCLLSRTRTMVRIVSAGTASLRVKGTSTVLMSVRGEGQTYSVSVDEGPPSNRSTTSCDCWETDPVANGLSPEPHQVMLTNTTAPTMGGLDVQAWLLDTGGSLPVATTAVDSDDPAISYSSVTFVDDPNSTSGRLAMVPFGQVVTVFVRNAGAAKIEYLANGTRIDVRQADKNFAGYELGPAGEGGDTISLPNTGKERRYAPIEWGLQPGLVKISITVISGTLALDRILVTQQRLLGRPTVVGAGSVGGVPVLAAYGDSITVGLHTLGPTGTSDGFADRLAGRLGFILSDQATGGTAASYYGVDHVGDVIATEPDAVVVAYGVNDILGDFFGCKPSLREFRRAMDRIVLDLQASLPGVPIYLGAILPTPAVPEDTRAKWNQVIQNVAIQDGAAFVDPSSVLDPAVDYVDDLHPNNGGAEKIAAYWSGAILAA
jgi:lysophospholipase L1-like esterase